MWGVQHRNQTGCSALLDNQTSSFPISSYHYSLESDFFPKPHSEIAQLSDCFTLLDETIHNPVTTHKGSVLDGQSNEL